MLLIRVYFIAGVSAPGIFRLRIHVLGRMVPVQDRVVKTHFDALLFTLPGQFRQDILLVRSEIHDVVV